MKSPPELSNEQHALLMAHAIGVPIQVRVKGLHAWENGVTPDTDLRDLMCTFHDVFEFRIQP